jgi:hypothetical protein
MRRIFQDHRSAFSTCVKAEMEKPEMVGFELDATQQLWPFAECECK